MSRRKSIVSAFGDFQKEQDSDEATASVGADKQKTGRVAAGIIGTTQRTLTQIREERDALLEQAATSRHVVDIDPELIDASPFRDRLPDDDSDNFESFKRSIAEEGQKVPITVRQHPDSADRFQVVYGHRRLRALKELKVSVSAVVAQYSDRDLAIAQGIENANRQDLTWIERALFADEMQSAGVKPKDIKAALSIDDAELSKLRSVTKAVPRVLIELIGRAPIVGRPRWLELSKLLRDRGDVSLIEKTLSDDKVCQLSSDERFLTALSVLKPRAELREAKAVQSTFDLGDVGSMKVSSKAINFNLEGKHRQNFARFLEAEMPSILERYNKSLEQD